MEIRDYDPKRDREAVHRIWREVGWLEKDREEGLDLLLGCSRAMVAEIQGEAESAVTTTPGSIRYLDEEVPFTCVTGLATSRIARKQGLATRALARALAADVADVAPLAGLGVFEQGFYNQLGFGTGTYEHWMAFDPASLTVATKARVPRRLSAEDWEMIHASRAARARRHGACNIGPAQYTRAEIVWTDKGFGLGYCDGPEGRLSHHLWIEAKRAGHGPYNIKWMAYRTPDEFRELMALIKSLSDQVPLVEMREPKGMQLQDLVAKPFRHRQVTEKSRYENRMDASAYWQIRICDLPGCLARTRLRGSEVRFNLELSDPIESFLGEDAPWRGAAGEYVVTLGPSSGAQAGADAALPTLRASVGAFTRMWLGVRPASGLAVTDQLAGPEELLQQLDRALRLPEPSPDWDF